MIEIPRFSPLRITQRTGRPSRADIDSSDQVLIVLPQARKPAAAGVPLRARVEKLAAVARRSPQRQATTRLENSKSTQLTVALAPRDSTAFERLSWARQLAAPAAETGGRISVIVLGCSDERYGEILDAVLSALSAVAFELASYRSTRRTHRLLRSAVVLGTQTQLDLRGIKAAAAGNNLARWLTALPPNKLDAASYRQVIESIAATENFEFEFFDEAQLRELGAGAFLAVCQGNDERDAGIVRLTYRPKRPPTTDAASLALVGKGIIFDTGGNNLKPFRSMLDMHMDMQGSAVALGVLLAATAIAVPYEIELWLAITENRISARAYKSQDVVTALNGTTIQVIHTDAEGRMVLADTLALASRSSPDLIIDFATLTGACVTALTSRYSGVFCNRDSLHDELIAAGRTSGERVWPFPMDADFDEGLKSTVADVKQCAEDGAGDHILAAKFLARFVPPTIPWVHVDLAAAQHKGGLAHVPSEFTGFGVRFTLHLLQQQLRFGTSETTLPTS